MNKTEILAPCGDYNSVLCSINAGADAVYLGGPMFSARAYATNLSIDEIISAINYAHLHNKKIYLTVNTLLKNDEIMAAVNMIKPLYEAGLDAVIIQDLGLLDILQKNFSLMEIHISTQMSVMSRLGVRFFKGGNVTRVVPARELSADEIVKLKEEGLEIECFVHGAMCYSYSGKCLFSSIAGGRSGNRGRCAGPCRKSYDLIDLEGKTVCSNCYPISMKDMCTIEDMNLLLEANVDSFKIEGRMKAKEYSAGVSAIYKKYVENYRSGNDLVISKKDKKILSNLYVRSELQSGYLKKQNGKDMISLSSPAYNSVNENLINDIRLQFGNIAKIPIDITVNVFKDTLLSGIISYGEINVYAETVLVEAAKNSPVTEELIARQMCKLGNTNYFCDNCLVNTDNQSFVSTSTINELRRKLIEEFENELFSKRKGYVDFKSLELNKNNNQIKTNKARTILGVSNKSQYEQCIIHKQFNEYIIDLFSDIWSEKNFENKKIFVRLPAIIRDNKLDIIEKQLERILHCHNISGIYVNSIDGLMLAMKYFSKNQIYGDIGIYAFNDYSVDYLNSYMCEYTASLELNEKNLKAFSNINNRQLLIYGYIPVMYSANCLVNTANVCNKKEHGMYLKDENKRMFFSKCNHNLCYNTIYNNVPLCLFSEIDKIDMDYSAFRLDFTYEKAEEISNILENYQSRKKIGDGGNNNYTLGHYKRGVE